jgi:hypothetical protein
MQRQLARFASAVLIILGCYTLSNLVNRSDTFLLLSIYSSLFVILWFWIRHYSSLGNIFLLGVLCRLVFFDHIPELSQDFYRFLWDGQLQQLGINPYLHTPNQLINIVGFPDSNLLYEKMGSLSNGNFSNYPPASQYLFKLAALFHQESIMDGILTIRIIYFLGDIALFFVGCQLLKTLSFEPNQIAWYFLNPLVIIEGIGNLHGESLMFCFTLIGLTYLIQKRSFLGGIFMGIAIAIKLIPLLLIPVFFKYLGFKRFIYCCCSILLVSLLFWVPFWEGDMVEHYNETVRLWFTTFEFNGSIYNIIRAVGYKVKGYNIIRKLGEVTPFIIVGFIFIISFLRSNRTTVSLLKSMLLLLSVYFFIATTVHPWYIINLIFLGILSGYVYPLVWSLVVFWSYSAYGTEVFEEQTVIQITAYSMVYGIFLWELIKGPLGEHFQKPHFFNTELSPGTSR